MRRLIIFICIICFTRILCNAQITDKEKSSIHGKIDFLSEYQNNKLKTKLFVWNNKIKGGIGFEDIQDKRVSYIGGYYNQEFSNNFLSDLIIGGYYDNKTVPIINGTPTKKVYSNYEFQSDLFFKNGLGIGGGYVANNLTLTNIGFTKISFRNNISNVINYSLAIQIQFIGSHKYLGALGAIYSKSLFTGGAYDGEQWRADIGYIHPNDNKLCPAIEILYTDNSIGNFGGTNFFFINGTIDYKGGFLSNEARLGRALGPTGIVFSNPLGYLNPNTWNRIHNTWELGKMLDFRILYFPESNQSKNFEGNLIMYPTNFNDKVSLLDNIFIGYTYNKQLSVNDHIISAGYFGEIVNFGKTEKLSLVFSGSTGFNMSVNEYIGTVGLILKH